MKRLGLSGLTAFALATVLTIASFAIRYGMGLPFIAASLWWFGISIALLWTSTYVIPLADRTVGLQRKDVAVAVLLVAWAIGVVWGQGYLSPVFELQFAAGATHIDTLYLSSYANMLANYGAASTGVDGLVHVPYHFLSNLLMGLLGRIGNAGAFAAYHLGFPVVVVPLFFLLLLRLAESQTTSNRSIATIVVLVGIIGVVPQRWRYDVAIGWNAILISESYTVGLILLLLLCWLLWSRSPNNASQLSAVLLAMLLTFLSGVAKISIGVLIVVGAGYWWLRWQRRNMRALLWPLSMAVGAGAAYLVANDPAVSGGVRLFDFFRGYVSDPLLPWFFLQYWPLVLLWGTRTHGSDKEHRATEILTCIAVVGLVPGLILDIGGGSALYFSNVYYWPALVLVAVRSAGLWNAKRGVWVRYRRNPVALFAIAIAAGTIVVNVGSVLYPAVQETVQYTRNQEPQLVRLHDSLRELSGLTHAKSSLVWIDPDVDVYWRNRYPLDARAFVTPALSGLAVLSGIPSDLDLSIRPQYRGYGSFGQVERPASISNLPAALQVVDRDRFSTLHIIETDGGVLQLSSIDLDSGNQALATEYRSSQLIRRTVPGDRPPR